MHYLLNQISDLIDNENIYWAEEYRLDDIFDVRTVMKSIQEILIGTKHVSQNTLINGRQAINSRCRNDSYITFYMNLEMIH